MNYGLFSRPKKQKEVSGDAYIVQEWESYVLLALADGLGSGKQAAKAAKLAVTCVQERRADLLIEILRACHRALRETRGAVMSLLRVNLATGKVRYAGVGNVGIYVQSQDEFHPISYNGIVGYRLPRVHEFVGKYHPGDTFILYSDGVDGRFHSDATVQHWQGDLNALAALIAERYGKDNDDVCVLVAR